MKISMRGILVLLICCLFATPSFADLTDGLVAYYPFNGNANDESGNGNDGTVYGASLTDDKLGNGNSAYFFDGVDDYIEVAHSDLMNVVDGVTVSAWIVSLDAGQELPAEGLHIVNKGAEGDVQTYSLKLEADADGPDYLGMRLRGDWGPIHAYSTFPADELLLQNLLSTEWYHFVVLWDGSTMKVYKNGNHIPDADRSFTAIVLNGNEPLTIGSRFNLDRFFHGMVDEVRIYNRALSQTEITQLYNYTPPQPPWGSSEAQASSIYGSKSAKESKALNSMILLMIPLGAIFVWRVFRKRK